MFEMRRLGFGKRIPEKIKNILAESFNSSNKGFVTYSHWFPQRSELPDINDFEISFSLPQSPFVAKRSGTLCPMIYEEDRISEKRSATKELKRTFSQSVVRPIGKLSNTYMPVDGSNISFAYILCININPLCNSAHGILTEGSRNTAPIILAYKMTQNASEMVSNIISQLSSIQGLKNAKHPLLILVGTYDKSFDKKRRMKTKIQECIRKRYSWMEVYFKTVCTGSGENIKKLGSFIIQKLLDATQYSPDFFKHPYLDSECSGEWYQQYRQQIYIVIETIKKQKEEIELITDQSARISLSFITWTQFELLLDIHGFPESESERVALFLRHLGLIQFYRDIPELVEPEIVGDIICLFPELYVNSILISIGLLKI